MFVIKCGIAEGSIRAGIDRAFLQQESQNLSSSHWYETELKMKWLDFSPSVSTFADLW